MVLYGRNANETTRTTQHEKLIWEKLQQKVSLLLLLLLAVPKQILIRHKSLQYTLYTYSQFVFQKVTNTVCDGFVVSICTSISLQTLFTSICSNACESTHRTNNKWNGNAQRRRLLNQLPPRFNQMKWSRLLDIWILRCVNAYTNGRGERKWM